MYKKIIGIFILFNISCLSLQTVCAADLFNDSFESGDLSATNANGFKWTDSSWTSIVSRTTEVWAVGPVNYPIANAASFPGYDWTPKTGNYSMRFRYAAGQAQSEQRFDLGTAMKDVWIRFWLRVPVNFAYGPVGSPNKFFAIWSDGYSNAGDGSTVWLGMHRTNTADATLAYTYSNGGFTVSNAYAQYSPFITTADKGRWMHIVMHYKTETSPGASDGQVQTYRRWDGDTYYTKLHQANNLPIKLPASGPQGFKAGYILGWANAAYTDNTEWILDDFAVADAMPSGIVVGSPPKPPTNFMFK